MNSENTFSSDPVFGRFPCPTQPTIIDRSLLVDLIPAQFYANMRSKEFSEIYWFQTTIWPELLSYNYGRLSQNSASHGVPRIRLLRLTEKRPLASAETFWVARFGLKCPRTGLLRQPLWTCKFMRPMTAPV
jgi:hypothetical protein